MKTYLLKCDLGTAYAEVVVLADNRGVRRGKVPAPVVEYVERWARGICFGESDGSVRVAVSEYSPLVLSSRPDTQRIAVAALVDEWEIQVGG